MYINYTSWYKYIQLIVHCHTNSMFAMLKKLLYLVEVVLL